MSLFGKILAVLNLLAAVAFVVLGFMDFAKRESWAYANYVFDVAVDGLPLDDKQTDDHERPLANELSNETLADWFHPDKVVRTQVEEVERVKEQVVAKVNAAGDDPQKQSAELARILQPFARHNAEREWLLGVRAYLATPEDAARLNKRLHDAFPAAVQACAARPGDLKFPQAFHDACHAQGGAPAEAFEQTFLKLLPAKPEKTFEDAVKAAQAVVVAKGAAPEQEAHLRGLAFLKSIRDDDKATLRNLREDAAQNKDSLDDLYAQTLTAVHDQLQGQLDALFDEAHNGPKSLADANARVRDYQRVAITHLLFNLVEILHDDAAEKGVAGSPDYARFLSVVGLKAGVTEISEQGWTLQRIGEELQGTRDMERGEFAAAHRAIIDDLQARAVNLQYANDQLQRDTEKLADEEQLLTRRRDDVKQAEDALAAARAVTDKQMADLRAKSDHLHKMRIDGRDVLGENLELERQIRDLEKKR